MRFLIINFTLLLSCFSFGTVSDLDIKGSFYSRKQGVIIEIYKEKFFLYYVTKKNGVLLKEKLYTIAYDKIAQTRMFKNYLDKPELLTEQNEEWIVLVGADGWRIPKLVGSKVSELLKLTEDYIIKTNLRPQIIEFDSNTI